MKQMDFFVRPGADPQPYGVYGKGLQRRMAEKTLFHVSLFLVRDTRPDRDRSAFAGIDKVEPAMARLPDPSQR
ncbi:MAG: hypothetical protein ACLGHV_10120 [Gammaproteobacteria bacterium]